MFGALIYEVLYFLPNFKSKQQQKVARSTGRSEQKRKQVTAHLLLTSSKPSQVPGFLGAQFKLHKLPERTSSSLEECRKKAAGARRLETTKGGVCVCAGWGESAFSAGGQRNREAVSNPATPLAGAHYSGKGFVQLALCEAAFHASPDGRISLAGCWRSRARALSPVHNPARHGTARRRYKSPAAATCSILSTRGFCQGAAGKNNSFPPRQPANPATSASSSPLCRGGCTALHIAQPSPARLTPAPHPVPPGGAAAHLVQRDAQQRAQRVQQRGAGGAVRGCGHLGHAASPPGHLRSAPGTQHPGPGTQHPTPSARHPALPPGRGGAHGRAGTAGWGGAPGRARARVRARARALG